MNIAEVADLFWLAMGCDTRLKQLDDRQLLIWSRILQDVPGQDGMDIVEKLYQRPRRVVLQPGDVMEAWEELQQDRAEAARLAAPDCPAHEGQKLPHCSGCRSEVLTGERSHDQIGVRFAPDPAPLGGTR